MAAFQRDSNNRSISRKIDTSILCDVTRIKAIDEKGRLYLKKHQVILFQIL